MLLDYGAGINVPDHYTKRPPVGWSWGPKRDPIHQFLIAKGAQVDTIRLACCIGDVDRVRAVLDADPALQSFKKRAAQADNGSVLGNFGAGRHRGTQRRR